MTRYLHLFFIGFGASLAFLDSSVNVAFPAITANFEITKPEIIWLVITFALPTISLMLYFGRTADRVGHRFIFQVGLAFSLIAFGATTLAPTYDLFLWGRIVQGVGAAAIIGAGMALARSLFDETYRARVIGYYVLMIAFAGALGPFIGGLMVEWQGWSGVFSFRAVIAALAFLLIFSLPKDATAMPGHRVVAMIVVMAFTGATGILFNLSPDWLRGFVNVILVGLGLYGIFDFFRLLLAGSELFEKFSKTDFVIFVLSNFRSIFIHFAASSVIFIIPFYLKDWRVLDYKSAGLALAFYPFGIAVVASQARRLFAKFEPRRIGNWGMIALLAGLWLTGGWTTTTATALLWSNLFLIGAGTGLFHISLNHYIIGVYGPEHRGTAGALIEFTRTVGILSAALILLPLFTILLSTASVTDPEVQFFYAFELSFKFISALPFALLVIAGIWGYIFCGIEEP
ncbi:MAG: hypothetical protein CMM26_02620 [Rhodospirillaceae bacterium]|nr:hypothetical protein [Rhodospirillaceae bacterium]